MDYNKVFEDNIDRKFFFSSYPGNKLMVGVINLEKAIARMGKNEYYTLVTYKEGEQLPQQYVPYTELSNDDTLYATINSDIRIPYIVRNDGIQMISRLGAPEDPISYLLGPGPERVTLEELINEQYEAVCSKGKSK